MSAADACFDLPIIPDATGLFEQVYDDATLPPFVWPEGIEVHEFGVSIPIREEDAEEWKAFVDNWNATEKKRQDYQCAKIFEDYMQRNDEAVQKALLIPDARSFVGYFVCPACGQDHEYGASCSSTFEIVAADITFKNTAPCPASPVGQSHPTSCVLCKGSGHVEAL